MMMNIDKRLITILNDMGVEITWDQFRKAYTARMEEREADPKTIKRRDLAARASERELEHYRNLLLDIFNAKS